MSLSNNYHCMQHFIYVHSRVIWTIATVDKVNRTILSWLIHSKYKQKFRPFANFYCWSFAIFVYKIDKLKFSNTNAFPITYIILVNRYIIRWVCYMCWLANVLWISNMQSNFIRENNSLVWNNASICLVTLKYFSRIFGKKFFLLKSFVLFIL